MKKKSNNKKYYYIGGAIIVLVVIILLLIVSCNKGYKVELMVDNKLFYQTTIHEGDTIEEVKEPTKEGYTFAGWYLDDEKFDVKTEIKEDMKLEARWTKNTYVVKIDSDNGKKITEKEVEYKDTITEPTKPTKKGYIFKGWYVDEEEFDFNTKITKDIVIKAKWTKNLATTYTVEHYQMGLDGKYSKPVEVEILNGTIGKTVSPKVKTYEGFTSPSIQKEKVLEDGKLVVKYYYERNKYTLDVDGDKGVLSTTGSGLYYYGETVKVGYTIKDGYTFAGLSEDLNENSYIMGASNKTIKITTTANTDTKYTVNHYIMELNGETYTLKETDKLSGTTDSKVTPEVKEYEGFSAPKEKEVTILGDGSLVVKYYYERNKYTLTVKGDKGVSTITGNGEYYYEEEVNVEVELKPGYEFEKGSSKFTYTMEAKNATVEIKTKAKVYEITYKLNGGTYASEMPTTYTVEDTIELGVPTKEGYTFDYYKVNGKKIEGTKIPSGTYTEDLIIEAIYKANEDTKYTVNHYIMELDGENYTLKETDKLSGTTDSKVTPEVKEYVGFSAPRKEELTITPDGKASLDYYYTRNKYTLEIVGDKGVSSTTGSGKYYYEEEVTNIGYTLKEGYKFDSYSVEIKNNTYKMGASDITIEVKTKPINYEIKYNLDGGKLGDNLTNPDTYNVEDEIVLNSPTKVGYDFAGWEIVNDNDTENVTMLKNNTIKNRTGELELKATYTPRNDTKYTVLHVFMNTEGKYADINSIDDCTEENLCKKTEHKGTTDSKVEVPFLNKIEKWFKNPSEKQEVTIKADGSAYVIYKYERLQYYLSIARRGNALKYLTIKLNGKEVENPLIYYGATFTVEASFDEKYPLHFDYTDEWEKISDNKISYTNTMTSDRLQTNIELNIDSYTIIFHGNNGNLEDGSDTYKQIVNVSIDKKYPSLEANKFIHDGYKFLGWSDRLTATTPKYSEEYFNLDGTFTLENDLSTTNGATIDLYAVWSANKNTVTFKWNNKTNENYKEYSNQNFEETITKPIDPTRAGYDFKGWYKNCSTDTICNEDTKWTFESDTMPNESLTLYAKWEAKTDTLYTIEYYYMDTTGHYITDKEVEAAEGNLDSIKDKYEKFEFHGTTDTEIEFTPIDKIGFKTAVLIDPVNGNQINKKFTINGDGKTVIKYYYERNKYILTIEKTDGVKSFSPEDGKEYYFGEKVSITATAKDGYHLLKHDDNTATTTDTFTYEIVSGENKVTINSEGHKYTVIYHNYDGTTSISVPNSVFVYGEDTNLIGKSFTKNPYILTIKDYNKDYDSTSDEKITFNNTFIGWSTSQNSRSTEYINDLSSYIPKKCNDKLNLYAVYRTDTYTLTQPLVKSGYNFKGFKDGDNIIPVDEYDNYTIDADKQITAEWELINYNLRYTGATDCKECVDRTYTIEDTISLPILSKAGYDFNGWLINDESVPVKEIRPGQYNIDITLSPSWTAKDDIPYTIELYYMDTTGNYPKVANQTISDKKGTTDTEIEYLPDEKEGFKTAVLKESADGNVINKKVTINGDGTTTLKYYYERKQFTLNIKIGTGISSAISSGLHYFEEEVELNTVIKPGYHDVVWTGGTVVTDKYKMTSSEIQSLSVSATANKYTIKYYQNGDNKKELNSVICTYDSECTLNNFEKARYNITYHDTDGTNNSFSVLENEPYIYSCTYDGSIDCKDAISKKNNTYVAKNVTTENNAEILLNITWVSDLLIPSDREDYAFGGWSSDVIEGNKFVSGNILGYGEVENKTFETEYKFAKAYTINEDTNLYAYWWERPYVQSVAFDMVNVNDLEKEPSLQEIKPANVVVGTLPGKKVTAFYVELPEDPNYLVRIFTLSVGLTVPTTLNSYASIDALNVESVNNPYKVNDLVATNTYDSKGNKNGNALSLMGFEFPFASSDGKNWKLLDPGLGGLLETSPDFRQMLLAPMFKTLLIDMVLSELNLGVADKFGCNGLACSPHYVSIYSEHINNKTYFFFSTESAMDEKYRVEYKVGDNILYSIEIPKGSPIPDLGKGEVIGEDNTKYNIAKWDNSDSIMIANGDSDTITINGTAAGVVNLNKNQYKIVAVPQNYLYSQISKFVEETQNVGE